MILKLRNGLKKNERKKWFLSKGQIMGIVKKMVKEEAKNVAIKILC